MATRREKEQREVRYADAKERAEKHDKGFEPTALNVPKGAKLFRFKKKGLYRLDFLPYVAGKGNPFADEGFLAYERTYYTHRIPTATGTQMYVCLARTFAAKCPVCAFIAKALREGTIDQQTAKDMDVKERQLFNVIDLDNVAEGVQLFEFNWWQLGKLIDSRVDKKEKYKSFYHLKGGYTIEIEVDEETYKGKMTRKPIGISFEPRDNYDNDILDQVHNLDEIPKRLTYEELEKILLEGGEDNDKEKDAPAPSKNGHTKTKAKDDDEDEDEDDLEEDEDEDEDEDEGDDPTAEDRDIEKGSKVSYRKKEWKVVKVSGDGTSLTLEDDEGEQERGVAPSDVRLLEEEEEEEEDPTPARGAGSAKSPATAGARKPSTSNDDEDEDELDEDDELEDEDEEDEPAPKKKKRVG